MVALARSHSGQGLPPEFLIQSQLFCRLSYPRMQAQLGTPHGLAQEHAGVICQVGRFEASAQRL
jgi:hypothetical protein